MHPVHSRAAARLGPECARAFAPGHGCHLLHRTTLKSPETGPVMVVADGVAEMRRERTIRRIRGLKMLNQATLVELLPTRDQ
jgi:hypothetical protein